MRRHNGTNKSKETTSVLVHTLLCSMLAHALFLKKTATAFSTVRPPTTYQQQRTDNKHDANYRTRLHLVPLIQCQDDLPYFTDWTYERGPIQKDGTFEVKKEDGSTTDVYNLCVVEESDLPDLSRFIITSFGSDAIRMSSDLNTFETLLMRPAIELVNGYSGLVAFAEVLAGLRGRIEDRLENPSNIAAPKIAANASKEDQLKAAARTSLVLVLAKKQSNPNNWHIDIMGSVELRLEPSDAKIPFTLPFLDKLERQTAKLFGGANKNSVLNSDLQPYLSNLCIDSRYRGQGIGRSLVKCVEDIAMSNWGYDQMYLHVDKDNKGALYLYSSEGYSDAGQRWKPFWAGQAAEIGYYVKQLKSSKSIAPKKAIEFNK